MVTADGGACRYPTRRGGDDELYGGGGRDYLQGCRGNDLLDGWPGNDDLPEPSCERGCGRGLIGGAGEDRLIGGDGADKLNGSTGADTITGGDGPDVLLGSGDNDRFFARDSFRDVLGGGGGTDRARVDRGLDRTSGIERRF